MDRLTRRIKSGKADCAYCNYEYEGDDNHCSPSCSVRNAQMEKLARYEDAEEQGLLIKLPCKVGDTVYELMHDEIAAPADYIGEYEVQDVSARQIKYADDWVDIGYKNLYLTRAAAEEALKGTRRNNMDRLTEKELKMLLDLYKNYGNPLERAIYLAAKEVEHWRGDNEVTMAREEAIFQLQDLRSHCKDFSEEGSVWQKDIEALDMAIKALQEWIQEEYNESEIDWSKVAVDTPIYVGDIQWDIDNNIRPMHFARYENGKIYAWNNGETSFSAKGTYGWKYAKLAEAEE